MSASRLLRVEASICTGLGLLPESRQDLGRVSADPAVRSRPPTVGIWSFRGQIPFGDRRDLEAPDQIPSVDGRDLEPQGSDPIRRRTGSGVQEGYGLAPVHPYLKHTSSWPFVVRHPPLSVGAGRPCADQSCRAEPSLLEHRQISTKRSRELLGMACLLWWHLALKVRAGVSSLYCIRMTGSN